eukprot:CAMPEP_0184644238 /NCGR_PEP_ID=MMETSP0308-20130426/1001_1 /TAXON_ID=38269 /ORGANISM="Gloeochaete witrockiana, Strain SAG 46.84" /LENGTH=110 /DNA_ID=CAMNT_0027072669 /DNA_START=77 /DNA_END=409 /DNA_ORIENTATION=+
MAAFVLTSTFVAPTKSFKFGKAASNICQVIKAEEESVEAPAAPAASPFSFVGGVQGWYGKTIKLEIVYPTLNGTTIPASAKVVKKVDFASFNTEYQRIAKSGGKIVAVGV